MTDSEMLAAIRALLPDTYSDSKDWRTCNVTERIMWLKFMVESKTEEVDRLIDILNDNRIEAQAAEIERLRGDLAKAVKLLTLCRDMFDEVAHPSDPLSVMLNETIAALTGTQKDGS